MAMVDFSNARIEPNSSNTGTSLTWKNPTGNANVTLAVSSAYLRDSSLNVISSAYNRTLLVNEQKQLMYLYQGTFTASGTEFLIHEDSGHLAGWRISNISFNSGDTFTFKIRADLICQ